MDERRWSTHCGPRARCRTRAACGCRRQTSGVAEDDREGVAARLARDAAPSLRRVINATGVILHTNLGRAPLGRGGAGPRRGAGGRLHEPRVRPRRRRRRGRRDTHAERLLCRLTGAEAAVVVNNNAAATLLVLTALAAGREVIISRGELVEIGGGFRVPDVMAQSGAVLREVGTTNRTRAADYAAAIGDRTALILRVHPSNFRIEGFTERPGLDELVALGRRFERPGGRGHRFRIPRRCRRQRCRALRDEPAVADSIAAGADAVMFSGDKLLGGPQSRHHRRPATARVSQVRTHPLMRALRVDKLTYAALEATLEEFVRGTAAADRAGCRGCSR